MNSEQVRGLYLVPPHGEWIATGAKSAVVKSKYVPGHRLFDLRGDWMLVSKVDGVGLGLGDMTLGEPVEVSLDEFDTKESEHRVSRVDRMRWWPECETLWEYPVEGFKGYDKPLTVDVPAGVQTVMSSVMRQDVDTGSSATAGTGVKARHSRSQCMECESPPVVDVQWANARGRAWFCLPCFKEWTKDSDRDIVRAYYLSDGEAPVKIGEGEQVKKWGERLSQEALVERVESLIAREGEKEYSSVAIALSIPPSVAKKLAVEGTAYEGGEGQGVIPADQLHLTLAFLGDAKELEKRQELLQEGVAAFAAKNQVVSGEVKGRIVFDTPNGSAVCAHFDSPELSGFRQELVMFLDNLGFELKSEHGFTPHICLAYVEPGQEAGIETPTIPGVTLGELSVLWGNDRTDYQLREAAEGDKAGRWRTLSDGQHVRPGSSYPPKGSQGAFSAMREKGKMDARTAMSGGRAEIVENNLRVMETALQARAGEIDRIRRTVRRTKQDLAGEENLEFAARAQRQPAKWLRDQLSGYRQGLASLTTKYWERSGYIQGAQDEAGK